MIILVFSVMGLVETPGFRGNEKRRENGSRPGRISLGK